MNFTRLVITLVYVSTVLTTGSIYCGQAGAYGLLEQPSAEEIKGETLVKTNPVWNDLGMDFGFLHASSTDEHLNDLYENERNKAGGNHILNKGQIMAVKVWCTNGIIANQIRRNFWDKAGEPEHFPMTTRAIYGATHNAPGQAIIAKPPASYVLYFGLKEKCVSGIIDPTLILYGPVSTTTSFQIAYGFALNGQGTVYGVQVKKGKSLAPLGGYIDVTVYNPHEANEILLYDIPLKFVSVYVKMKNKNKKGYNVVRMKPKKNGAPCFVAGREPSPSKGQVITHIFDDIDGNGEDVDHTYFYGYYSQNEMSLLLLFVSGIIYCLGCWCCALLCGGASVLIITKIYQVIIQNEDKHGN